MPCFRPRVLPIREQIRVVYSLGKKSLYSWLRMVGKKQGWKWAVELDPVKVYVPDFKKGIDHFCIHAGGRAVIDGIEQNLSLSPAHTAPSRAVLRDFGRCRCYTCRCALHTIPLRVRGDTTLRISNFGRCPVAVCAFAQATHRRPVSGTSWPSWRSPTRSTGGHSSPATAFCKSLSVAASSATALFGFAFDK